MKTTYPIHFSVIVAATDGDIEAINQIVKHYKGHMSKRSLRPMKDDYGNQQIAVEEALSEFDRYVFENIVEKVIVGGYDENGNKDPAQLTFLYETGVYMNTDFVNLTTKNLAGEHLCCIIRSKKPHQGIDAKRQWLSDRLNEGHVFRKLNARAAVFIEYAPLETRGDDGSAAKERC